MLEFAKAFWWILVSSWFEELLWMNSLSCLIYYKAVSHFGFLKD